MEQTDFPEGGEGCTISVHTKDDNGNLVPVDPEEGEAVPLGDMTISLDGKHAKLTEEDRLSAVLFCQLSKGCGPRAS